MTLCDLGSMNPSALAPYPTMSLPPLESYRTLSASPPSITLDTVMKDFPSNVRTVPTIVTIGNNDLIQFGNVDHALRFSQTCDASNSFALSNVHYFESVVAQSRNEQSLTLVVCRKSADAARVVVSTAKCVLCHSRKVFRCIA